MQQLIDQPISERAERVNPRGFSAGRNLLPWMVLMLALGIVAEPLISTVNTVYDYVAQRQYELYLARLERSNLKEANSRMLSELIALRSKRTRGSDRESSLTQKISELESLIDGVTSLGLFRSQRARTAKSGSSRGNQSTRSSGELAAILNSPQLADAGSLTHETAFVNTGDGTAPSELLERIDRFNSVLRFLPLGAPVQGSVTSGFGHRRSPFSHRRSFHAGVDLSLKSGSKVMATGAGRVVKVARDRTYGNMVDIEHAPGLVTRYAHLSKSYVFTGQLVERGSVIALSGNTGRSTGPHLHYEVRHNDQALNPAPFVQLAGRLAELVDGVGVV
jgi:murein DD-endopeptidase MepM/ murein hydrolase activator NlpD